MVGNRRHNVLIMPRIAINGFGRIGRALLRIALEKELEVVAINDLSDKETLAHLLKFDSIYGRYSKDVSLSEKGIRVGDKEILLFSEKSPSSLNWKELNVDVVIECTGIFRDREGAEKHIVSGAKYVIISAPAKGSDIPSFILGVNEEEFNPKNNIVDMGSCTTNCLAPIAKIINDSFLIKNGFITTTHSYTNDQRILDFPHKDLRRARAAALNIIPTSTGAAKAISKVIPSLEKKLDGISLRVPTPVVSILDIFLQVEKETSREEVLNILEKYSGNILKIEEKELVSSDYIGDPHSAIIDKKLLMVNGNLLKIVAWYDNEYAYATRLAEFANYIGKYV